MNEEIDRLIAETLTVVLGRSVEKGKTVVRKTESNWDSLKHIEIIFVMEEAFHIQFTEEDMQQIENSDDLKKLVVKKHAT